MYYVKYILKNSDEELTAGPYSEAEIMYHKNDIETYEIVKCVKIISEYEIKNET